MSNIDDHFDAKKDDLKGQAKEKLGNMTDDKSTENEGKMDQVKGDIKEGVADVKDKVGDFADKLRNNEKK